MTEPLTALQYLEQHMNDEEDSWVVPSSANINGGHSPSFKRVGSGHHVGIGEHSSYFTWDSSARPPGISYEEYLLSLKLKIRWLGEYRGQSLAEQLQYCNIYYVVDGLEKLPGLLASSYFWTSIHLNSGYPGAFFSSDLPVMKEFWRMKEVEQCQKEIATGEAAKLKLAPLMVSVAS